MIAWTISNQQLDFVYVRCIWILQRTRRCLCLLVETPENLLWKTTRHYLLLRASLLDKPEFVGFVKRLKVLWIKGVLYTEFHYDYLCVCTIDISRGTSLDFPNTILGNEHFDCELEAICLKYWKTHPFCISVRKPFVNTMLMTAMEREMWKVYFT